MLPNTRRAGPRPGFTLVELLVVIAIMAVLVALAMGGVQRARDAAKRTEAANAIGQLDTAISQFKQTYPGARRVPCAGGGVDANGNALPFRLRARYPAAAGAFPLDVSSASAEAVFLKSMFPRMMLDPVVERGTQNPIDQQFGTGLPNLDLNPNQCLVFFLGGYFLQVDTANPGTNRRQMWVSGNLTDPILPFRHDTTTANPLAPYGQVPNNVKGPAMQFPPGRLDLDLSLLDAAAGTQPQLLDRSIRQNQQDIVQSRFSYAPQFLDPWDTPYMYVTTATANNDYIVPGLPTRASISITAVSAANVIQIPVWGNKQRSVLPDYPTNEPPRLMIRRSGANNGPFRPFQQSANRSVNEKTHQIISAGRDQILGGGGLYRGGPDELLYAANTEGGDDMSNFVVGVLANKE